MEVPAGNRDGPFAGGRAGVRVQASKEGSEVEQFLRRHVDDDALALDAAVDAEQAGAQARLAEALEDVGPDDQVGDAGFVLDGDEDDALGGTGALAGDHQPRHLHLPAGREVLEAAAGHETAAAELVAQHAKDLFVDEVDLGPERFGIEVEAGIADGIDCFHMDALSSAVAMKITCDLQLTLMASSLYRLLGAQVGRGYKEAKGRHIFRDFIDAVGLISLTDDAIIVRYQKRAHNPLLIAAGFANTDVSVPWLGDKRLRLVFG